MWKKFNNQLVLLACERCKLIEFFFAVNEFYADLFILKRTPNIPKQDGIIKMSLLFEINSAYNFENSFFYELSFRLFHEILDNFQHNNFSIKQTSVTFHWLTKVDCQILCVLNHGFEHLPCYQFDSIFCFLCNQPLQHFFFFVYLTLEWNTMPFF